ncbi:MAG: aldo/keto reductase [Candidatus Marinimicrobia bacterium]|nr:aldo/keto reductase [Candidatus Neomarinimicrobiota bacterium]
MNYLPYDERYEKMDYRFCGKSGLKLPQISLGLWHNFGSVDIHENARKLILHAFDNGITHFDLANNYGPAFGTAEKTFGRILKEDLTGRRDELVISTKAGYLMWPGPYGNGGSRKYLIASLDQSLQRMGLDYVDIFYHHRPDPETLLEETMMALDHIVRSGKALYIGVSSYSPEQTLKAAEILSSLGTPCRIHQPKYNMLYRDIEKGLFDVLRSEGIGCAVFSPLQQGVLTGKYLNGIPKDSRAGRPEGFLKPEHITEQMLNKVRALSHIAENRGQTMSQMAVSWVLRRPEVSTAIIGARKISHIDDALKASRNTQFSKEELEKIDHILEGKS